MNDLFPETSATLTINFNDWLGKDLTEVDPWSINYTSLTDRELLAITINVVSQQNYWQNGGVFIDNIGSYFDDGIIAAAGQLAKGRLEKAKNLVEVLLQINYQAQQDSNNAIVANGRLNEILANALETLDTRLQEGIEWNGPLDALADNYDGNFQNDRGISPLWDGTMPEYKSIEDRIHEVLDPSASKIPNVIYVNDPLTGDRVKVYQKGDFAGQKWQPGGDFDGDGKLEREDNIKYQISNRFV